MCKSNSKKYTFGEQMRIIRYLIDQGDYHCFRGKLIWKEMEKKKIVSRSWQSLKDHFRRVLINNLDQFEFEFNRKDLEKITLGYKESGMQYKKRVVTSQVWDDSDSDVDDDENDGKVDDKDKSQENMRISEQESEESLDLLAGYHSNEPEKIPNTNNINNCELEADELDDHLDVTIIRKDANIPKETEGISLDSNVLVNENSSLKNNLLILNDNHEPLFAVQFEIHTNYAVDCTDNVQKIYINKDCDEKEQIVKKMENINESKTVLMLTKEKFDKIKKFLRLRNDIIQLIMQDRLDDEKLKQFRNFVENIC